METQFVVHKVWGNLPVTDITFDHAQLIDKTAAISQLYGRIQTTKSEIIPAFPGILTSICSLNDRKAINLCLYLENILLVHKDILTFLKHPAYSKIPHAIALLERLRGLILHIKKIHKLLSIVFIREHHYPIRACTNLVNHLEHTYIENIRSGISLLFWLKKQSHIFLSLPSSFYQDGSPFHPPLWLNCAHFVRRKPLHETLTNAHLQSMFHESLQYIEDIIKASATDDTTPLKDQTYSIVFDFRGYSPVLDKSVEFKPQQAKEAVDLLLKVKKIAAPEAVFETFFDARIQNLAKIEKIPSLLVPKEDILVEYQLAELLTRPYPLPVQVIVSSLLKKEFETFFKYPQNQDLARRFSERIHFTVQEIPIMEVRSQLLHLSYTYIHKPTKF